jgi:hypothetical protein
MRRHIQPKKVIAEFDARILIVDIEVFKMYYSLQLPVIIALNTLPDSALKPGLSVIALPAWNFTFVFESNLLLASSVVIARYL